jgi:hypothetical protein
MPEESAGSVGNIGIAARRCGELGLLGCKIELRREGNEGSVVAK